VERLDSHRALGESKRVADIEADRRGEEVAARLVADIVVSFRRLERGGAIDLRNNGPASATDVDLQISPEESGLIVRLEGLPIGRLGPCETRSFVAITTAATDASVPARLSWSDPSGAHDEVRHLSTVG
jgi:hypothetical protein